MVDTGALFYDNPDVFATYLERRQPLIIIAGADYGQGSSRDWAAKGVRLAGVEAIVAEGFERIHRTNLIGMGVLPLEFKPGTTRLRLNLDGTDSPRTQSVRAFARNLAPLALPVLLWDERWSTVAVERAMIEADMSRAKRAEKVDAHAAAHILQGAIDALVNLPPSS